MKALVFHPGVSEQLRTLRTDLQFVTDYITFLAILKGGEYKNDWIFILVPHSSTIMFQIQTFFSCLPRYKKPKQIYLVVPPDLQGPRVEKKIHQWCKGITKVVSSFEEIQV